MKYTPGPWTVTDLGRIVGSAERHTNGRERLGGNPSSASWSAEVALVHGNMHLPAPFANAHLIAAAPGCGGCPLITCDVPSPYTTAMSAHGVYLADPCLETLAARYRAFTYMIRYMERRLPKTVSKKRGK